jgi:hypothetical protein
MIGIKYQKPRDVFQVLIDSDPDPSMITCTTQEGAGRLVYNYYLEAMKELEKQFSDALIKIRSKDDNNNR